jgi:hypothetical protein
MTNCERRIRGIAKAVAHLTSQHHALAVTGFRARGRDIGFSRLFTPDIAPQVELRPTLVPARGIIEGQSWFVGVYRSASRWKRSQRGRLGRRHSHIAPVGGGLRTAFVGPSYFSLASARRLRFVEPLQETQAVFIGHAGWHAPYAI